MRFYVKNQVRAAARRRGADHRLAGEKTALFVQFLYKNAIIVPRQARDKHKKMVLFVHFYIKTKTGGAARVRPAFRTCSVQY
eukprot:COSAG06_NODE_4008_length_4666_cov_3.913072_4_plen_82_part_00